MKEKKRGEGDREKYIKKERESGRKITSVRDSTESEREREREREYQRGLSIKDLQIELQG